MIRRKTLAVLAALALAVVGASIPASGATAAAKDPVDCVAVPGSYWRAYDTFHCQEPPPPLVYPGNLMAQNLDVCYNVTNFQDAAHPAPNGWGNAISSMKNISNYRLEFWDTNGCSGAILLAMQPQTMRTTLNSLANNKISSMKVRYPF